MNERTDDLELERGERVHESYDECDGEPAFIIADVTTDDAWLSISEGEEIRVSEHR